MTRERAAQIRVEPVTGWLEVDGWLEWLVVRCLTGREQLIVEYLAGQTPTGWSRQWRSGLIISLSGVTISLVVPQAIGWLVLLGSGVLATVWMEPAFGGAWPGISGAFVRRPPAYIVMPLSFWEIGRALVKVNVTRCLVALPVLAWHGAWLMRAAESSPWLGILGGAKLALALALLQPLWLVMKFSEVSNDTHHFRWGALWHIGLLVFTGLGSLAASAVAFVPEWWALLAFVPAAVLPVLLLLNYGWWFNRTRFDALKPVPVGQL